MNPIIIAITDPALPSPQTWLQAALDLICRHPLPPPAPPRPTWIHLRARTLTPDDRLAAALTLRAACRAAHLKLMLNADLDLALAADADGLHLPDGAPAPDRAALPRPLILSRACHTPQALAVAHREGFDLATLSPVFPPRSKQPTHPALGLDALARACAASPIPVIALGGLDTERADACLQAGAAGVAAIGWFFAP